MASFKKFYTNLFEKHLLATNVVTCATLLGVGDCMVQKGNIAFEKRKGHIIAYDYERTGRMVVMGCILGPFNHYWYTFLDKALVGKGGKIVFKKIMSDQMVAGPFFCTSFLLGMGIMEGKSTDEAVDEWKDKFLSIYMVDWLWWPAAQFINFKYVPSKFRVLYVSVATLIWNSFLSFMKHRDDEEDLALIRNVVSVVNWFKKQFEKAARGRRSD